jgi:hypothetical protein
MGTVGSFPGAKYSQGMMLTTHPLLVPKLIMIKSYTSSPAWCLHGSSRTALLTSFLLYVINLVFTAFGSVSRIKCFVWS